MDKKYIQKGSRGDRTLDLLFTGQALLPLSYGVEHSKRDRN